MSRIALVVNPTAGRGRAGRRLPAVVEVLRGAGHDVDVQLGTSEPEARRRAAAAVDGGIDVLAVMGGDGMMHLGLNACAPARDAGRAVPALGLLPAGTGNDLCRGLGLDPDDPIGAAHAVARGEPRSIDLLRVGDRLVGGVLATGFDALVNRRANAMPWPKGGSRYPLSALLEIATFRPLAYRLVLDGVVRDLDAMLVAVGNTTTYGGGMRICPRADPFDGWLDVTVIHPVDRLTLLRLLPQMRSGRFVRHSCVEQLRARTVRVEVEGPLGFGDGELIGAGPLDVELLPAAQPVLLPAR